jgi:hypothetical protein
MLFAISLILIVIIGFYLLNKKTILPKRNRKGVYTIDDQYNSTKKEIQDEIDVLLGKMGKNGTQDLTEKQRKRLEELSKKLK